MLRFSRRDLLRYSAAGLLGVSQSGWLSALADTTAESPQRRRACILLWMHGGPSQMDTFDLKPGHDNGGPFKEIATSVPGIRISEHLPRVAKQMDRLAILRSMATKEGDHARGAFHLKTGYTPQGPVAYPPLGALVAKQLAQPDQALPGFVSISPVRTLTPSTHGSGFLGPRYSPLMVGDTPTTSATAVATDPAKALAVPDLLPAAGIDARRAEQRLEMLQAQQREFLAARRDGPQLTHQASVEGAMRLMSPTARKAFDLEEEPAVLRDSYGRTLFGQGCLLARRLVQRGVPFVEVTLGGSADGTSGWDTHYYNFETVTRLSKVLDAAWSTLLDDLKTNGLLDTTMVVWAGEFGRTPKINQLQGRDHYPNAWTTVLSGGGIKGGQVIGRTSKDGTTVEERPITEPDFLATICLGLGIDPTGSNMSNVGRPINIVDKAAKPIREVLA